MSGDEILPSYVRIIIGSLLNNQYLGIMWVVVPFFNFSPLRGDMIHFDLHIFFKRVDSTIN